MQYFNRFYKKITISNELKKEFARFAVSFFFAWLVSALISDFPFFKYHIIQRWSFDLYLTQLSVFFTETALNVIGFNTFSQRDFLQIEGTPGIIFAYGCLGIRQFSFFVVFILIQPGLLKNKLWYIPAGILLLFALNIIRAVIIAIGQYNNPPQTDLIHDIVSPVLMYPAILFLWLYWVSKYSAGKRVSNVKLNNNLG